MKNSFYNRYKKFIISTPIILFVAGYIYYTRNKELDDYGIVVEGKIIECQMVRTSGACVVKIEFTTTDGKYRTSVNTLYKDTNCQIGKVVKIQYSVISNLTDVLE